MNAIAPVKPRRDPWRIGAAIGMGSLVPSTVLAWVLVLSTQSFSRCLTYSEECDPNAGTLTELAWWSFWASAAAGLLAVLLSRGWRAARFARPPLVIAQVALLVITFGAVAASA